MFKMLIAAMIAMSCTSLIADDKTELKHMKEVLWPKAYREHDAELLGMILHPTFQMVDSRGNWSSRAKELADLPSYAWPHDDFAYDINRLDIYDDMAVIAGEGRAHGITDGERYCLRYQSTNILIKAEDRWQAVSSHVSGVTTQCDEN